MLNLYFSDNKIIVFKLTCFWAFTEAGLGGLLHLFHIPITGFVIGGFAIIIITLIAKYSGNNVSVLLAGMSTVLAVKFFLSPFSPVGAYVAVAFQGLLGAFVFSSLGLKNLTVALFSIVVMMESAIQKPLIAWLIAGDEFWKSSSRFFQNQLGIEAHFVGNIFGVLFSIYLLVYIVWGIIVCNCANYIRKNIARMRVDKTKVEATMATLSTSFYTGKKHKRNAIWIALLIFFVSFVFVLVYFKLLTLGYVLRTVIIMFILFVVIPFIIKKQQTKMVKRNGVIIKEVINAMPLIKQKVAIAYIITRPLNTLKRIKYFVGYAIWLNVFYED